ncbi:MAG: inorganic diphosphatase [Candidatus Pacebacteria bacterium]|nr:inorganic diphosphatase [Candidatus Paceibacterota bacterium]NUQ56999.1 inorganic diphosphatase [Candidatus Paceibacter sp.]
MSLLNIKIGDKAPEIINVVIEIPKDSQNKYEIDKQTGIISLDRVLYSPVHYPADYGFIPETKAEDGDPADVMVLGSDPLFPGCVARVRPIGILRMIDAGEQDNKILGVQADNPRFDAIKDISDIEKLHTHSLKEIAHFFQTYKELQGKKVEILGWENSSAAKKEIERAMEMYK